jgi:hypothetical protein
MRQPLRQTVPVRIGRVPFRKINLTLIGNLEQPLGIERRPRARQRGAVVVHHASLPAGCVWPSVSIIVRVVAGRSMQQADCVDNA